MAFNNRFQQEFTTKARQFIKYNKKSQKNIFCDDRRNFYMVVLIAFMYGFKNDFLYFLSTSTYTIACSLCSYAIFIPFLPSNNTFFLCEKIVTTFHTVQLFSLVQFMQLLLTAMIIHHKKSYSYKQCKNPCLLTYF